MLMPEPFVVEKNEIVIRAGHSPLWLFPGIITFGIILFPLLVAIAFAIGSDNPSKDMIEGLIALFVAILSLSLSTRFSKLFVLAFRVANQITFNFLDKCVYRKGFILTKKIADLSQIADIVRVDRSAWIFKRAYYKIVMNENRFGRGIRITKKHTPTDPQLAVFEQEILPQIMERRINSLIPKDAVPSSQKNFFRKEGDRYTKKFHTGLVTVGILFFCTLSFAIQLLTSHESTAQDRDLLPLLLSVSAFFILLLLFLPLKITIDTKTRTISRYTVLGLRCKMAFFDNVKEIRIVRANYDSWLLSSTQIFLSISGFYRPMSIATQFQPKKLNTITDELTTILGKTLPLVYMDANKTSPLTLLGRDPRGKG